MSPFVRGAHKLKNLSLIGKARSTFNRFLAAEALMRSPLGFIISMFSCLWNIIAAHMVVHRNDAKIFL